MVFIWGLRGAQYCICSLSDTPNSGIVVSTDELMIKNQVFSIKDISQIGSAGVPQQHDWEPLTQRGKKTTYFHCMSHECFFFLLLSNSSVTLLLVDLALTSSCHDLSNPQHRCVHMCFHVHVPKPQSREGLNDDTLMHQTILLASIEHQDADIWHAW